MPGYAVVAEHVSKEYKIAQVRTSTSHYDPIRPALTRKEKFMQILPFVSAGKSIWALDDISFQVEKGEALGIVGPNGAGKTTLLRILSRVTKPTLGRAILRGRVGSLLEVGTGFHPELSGRENVYMGGSVLGMTKREIDYKFSEIVEFSGVEDFIDVPVKRYSSGMRVRLAFSVAVHLDPEILLVDEVLSVGDAAFRQKSLMKMNSATRENRTVLFVSHNLEAIEGLCDRAIFLNEGRIASEGNPQDVIRHYMETARSKTGVQNLSGIADLTHHAGRIPGGTPVLKSVKLVDSTGEETAFFRVGEDVVFQVMIDSGQSRFTSPMIAIGIDNMQGIRVVNLHMDRTLKDPFEFQGEAVVSCRFEECRLVPGLYYVKLAARERGRKLDVIVNAITFEVLPGDLYGTGRIETTGIFEPKVSWTIGNVGEPQGMADHSQILG